jgi:tetratricopeptide (TPR) repeat protein
MTRAALVAALAIAVAVGGAAPVAAQLTREQVLGALNDRQDDDQRRIAAAQIGTIGRMEDLPALVRALRDPDTLVRAIVERAIWQIWSRSGDADVDQLFAIGVEQMTSRAGNDAIDTFSRIIDRRPDFAEGWNKRATVHYLMGEYTKSLADCDEVMKRNPYHFGALSGYGMIYTKLGNAERALEYFERALAINPNLDGVREAADALRQRLLQQRKNTT